MWDNGKVRRAQAKQPRTSRVTKQMFAKYYSLTSDWKKYNFNEYGQIFPALCQIIKYCASFSQRGPRAVQRHFGFEWPRKNIFARQNSIKHNFAQTKFLDTCFILFVFVIVFFNGLSLSSAWSKGVKDVVFLKVKWLGARYQRPFLQCHRIQRLAELYLVVFLPKHTGQTRPYSWILDCWLDDCAVPFMFMHTSTISSSTSSINRTAELPVWVSSTGPITVWCWYQCQYHHQYRQECEYQWFLDSWLEGYRYLSC